MSQITDLSYYQRNWDLILNKAKDYNKNNKVRLKEQGRDKYKSCLNKRKIKRENMEGIGIIICLKKKKQGLKEYQKEYRHSKERYSKEKAAEFYVQNKEAIKEKWREHYKNVSQEKKKTRLKSTKEKGIKNWFNIKKKH